MHFKQWDVTVSFFINSIVEVFTQKLRHFICSAAFSGRIKKDQFFCGLFSIFLIFFSIMITWFRQIYMNPIKPWIPKGKRRQLFTKKVIIFTFSDVHVMEVFVLKWRVTHLFSRIICLVCTNVLLMARMQRSSSLKTITRIMRKPITVFFLPPPSFITVPISLCLCPIRILVLASIITMSIWCFCLIVFSANAGTQDMAGKLKHLLRIRHVVVLPETNKYNVALTIY